MEKTSYQDPKCANCPLAGTCECDVELHPPTEYLDCFQVFGIVKETPKDCPERRAICWAEYQRTSPVRIAYPKDGGTARSHEEINAFLVWCTNPEVITLSHFNIGGWEEDVIGLESNKDPSYPARLLTHLDDAQLLVYALHTLHQGDVSKEVLEAFTQDVKIMQGVFLTHIHLFGSCMDLATATIADSEPESNLHPMLARTLWKFKFLDAFFNG